MRSMTKLVAVWAVTGAACFLTTAVAMAVVGPAEGSIWMAVLRPACSGAATRDKTWTSGGRDQSSGSQVESELALTSRASFVAEGTGFESAVNSEGTDCGCCIYLDCQEGCAANALHPEFLESLQLARIDADLQRVISVWERLEDTARRAINTYAQSRLR